MKRKASRLEQRVIDSTKFWGLNAPNWPALQINPVIGRSTVIKYDIMFSMANDTKESHSIDAIQSHCDDS